MDSNKDGKVDLVEFCSTLSPKYEIENNLITLKKNPFLQPSDPVTKYTAKNPKEVYKKFLAPNNKVS